MPQHDTDNRRQQIAGLYRDVLGREPDQEGLDFWTGSQDSLEDIRQNFMGSEEYQRFQGNPGDNSAALSVGTPTSQIGITAAEVAQRDPTAQDTTAQPESAQPVQSALGTPQEEGTFQEAQTGVATQPGEQEAETTVDIGSLTDYSSLTPQQIGQLQANYQKTGGPAATDTEIRALYRQVLGREADAEGIEFWKNTGDSLQDIKFAFLTSPEYFAFRGQPGENADALAGGTKVTDLNLTPDQLEQYNRGQEATDIKQTIVASTAAPTGVPSLDQIKDQLSPGAVQSVADIARNVNNPNIPASAMQTYTQIAMQNSEFLDPNNPNFIADPVQQASVVQAVAAVQSLVDEMQATTYTAATAQQATATAATTDSSKVTNMEPAQGTLTALMEAAQGETPPEALVSYQLDQLLAGIEDGNIPAWAQPAVDTVEAQLSSRGLSRSSVGRASLTNVIIQAAIPLASQNATTEANTFMQNLNNRQQAAVVNAQNMAQMDLANLNNRQQARLQNAQSFLQMEMAQFNAQQQANMVNAQLQQQAYLSDQAAENAARQFNATSQNQMDQFVTQLNATIESQNAARQTAVSQFNAGEANAANRFTQQLELQREQFNAQMAAQIEQSNVGWRRQVNQLNTAGVNAVNQANAMNAFNLSNQALTLLWQEYRDGAKWTYDSNENQRNRETQLAMAALGNESATDATKVQNLTALGAAAFNFFKG